METITDSDKIDYLTDQILEKIASAGDYQEIYGEKTIDFDELKKEYLTIRAILMDYCPTLCTPENFGDDFDKEIQDHIDDTYI